MDPRSFDALTRSLAAPKTRRGLLAGVAALVVGARAASAQACPPGQTANRKGDCSCPPGTDPCQTGCFNRKTDLNNCGACGRTCTGGTCTKGECRCPAGSVLCGGICRTQASFAADLDNCGGCGVSCDDGNVCTTNTCSGGICQYPPVTCPNSEACTQVTCDPASGCVYDTVARDGFACTSQQVTSGGTCSGGLCVATTTTTTTTTAAPTTTTTTTEPPLPLICTPGANVCLTGRNSETCGRGACACFAKLGGGTFCGSTDPFCLAGNTGCSSDAQCAAISAGSVCLTDVDTSTCGRCQNGPATRCSPPCATTT